MTADEAIQVATHAIETRGEHMTPGIRAWPCRRWLWFGRRYWCVMDRYPFKGNNWVVCIDDKTGSVRSIRNTHDFIHRRLERHKRRRT
jgi:hypothetical protein